MIETTRGNSARSSAADCRIDSEDPLNRRAIIDTCVAADATAAIQDALDSCPDDQAVLLPAGKWKLLSYTIDQTEAREEATKKKTEQKQAEKGGEEA